ncbi:peptidase inhibitor 16 [Sceloporus undulatus]|uniref:peptidase inhibitor 16 n=1 Tax=Sceloporus undulatus TaxID=8520 RepID=UPI001C4D96EA|nr:peptidase inhibitor 16 [Sceloporus undulatus]
MLSSGLRIPLLPPFLLLLLTAMQLSWSFTSEDKKLIVDLHNQYRTKVSPPAADMRKMNWDPELETFAKDYATKCIWEHNKERGRRGENLFAMSGDLEVKTIVESWYNEYQYYNMTTLTCEEGQMCGHYTQVVWANSERVGCGTVFCETLEVLNDTDMHLVVCNYEPPGNVKGHKPYKEGEPCSMCPEGYSCKDSPLCEPSADEEETTASPEPSEPEPTATLSDSAAPQDITTGSAPDISESTQIGIEIGSETPMAEGPTASPTLHLDHRASPELQRDSDGTVPSLVTTGLLEDLTVSPGTLKTGTKQDTYSESPPSDDLAAPKPTMEQTLTTIAPVHSSPKIPSTPKPPTLPKPPSIPKPPSVAKPPSYPKPPSDPKLPPISKKPASHRLSAYAKAIKRQSNAIQSSAGKTASVSVCLPCLGCKQISQPEEIKVALKELTFRYPYAPCFSSLPRWQRHSKCSWCGHTWGNALRKARPYWLNTL